MKDYHVEILKRGDKLPDLSDANFFHSPELFHILERDPGCSHCMVVVSDKAARLHAHMLAILWRRGSLLPPYLFSRDAFMEKASMLTMRRNATYSL